MNLKNKVKIQNLIFAMSFMLVLSVPIISVNREDGAISYDENRYLAKRPSLRDDDGHINKTFATDFENWINDNIGLRPLFVKANAKLQYHIFRNLSAAGAGSSDYYLGPRGEFNYAEKDMLRDFQHKNLYSQEQLDELSSAYEKIRETLEQRGIRYYYMQCRDKHSIYPEQFMTSVRQYGKTSLVDQVVDNLKANTQVKVVDTTEILMAGKTDGETFGRYTDPSHWTERGGYLAYRDLMDTLNSSGGNYRVLEPSDYIITEKDMGAVIFGGIHEEDMQEEFLIADPKASENDMEITPLDGTGHRIFICEEADNDEVVLVIGDSYVENYILDDLAESFRKTIFVWGDYTSKFMEFIDLYQPTIVINENAERCSYRFPMIVDVAAGLKG
ncbi:hypothetical protein UYO_0469 [Lachnospiraceae bacterium JC7]|nr:hypothetical protein UYO_0469 [Lachnospiraceae bacterium JC7]